MTDEERIKLGDLINTELTNIEQRDILKILPGTMNMHSDLEVVEVDIDTLDAITFKKDK